MQKKEQAYLRDWNFSLHERLRKPGFAKLFILAAMEEELELQAALRKIVQAFGVNNFAKKIGMAPPNLLRAVNPKHNPTLSTLNRLLEPFDLRVTVAPIPKPRPKKVA